MPNFEAKKRKRRTTRGRDERRVWIDKLDKVFSLYIRMRDSKAYRFAAFRCISCGEVKSFDQMDCGHYIGRSCMPLRWNSSNCSGECRACNRMDSSHLVGYRKNLIMKLGQDAVNGSAIAQSLDPHRKLLLIKRLGERRVEALEAQKHDTKKWSVDEMKQLYMYYAALVLKLKNGE